MRYILSLFAVCFLQALQAQFPSLDFKAVISNGLSKPVYITNAHDGTNRLFIVEESGKIRIYKAGSLISKPFLDLTDSITDQGERGLLSVAFHPDYANNRYFFVYYINKTNDITIARFRASAANADKANLASGVVLLTIHKTVNSHFGGTMHFGKDGKMYFATGDSGNPGDPDNAAQNGQSLLGKLIRINVNNFSKPPYYTIPDSNPYVGNASIRDEIAGLGLRNPYRWSFDRLTGDLWLADVGQDSVEEVNYLPYNERLKNNFGWDCFEGTHIYSGCTVSNNNVSPSFEYLHSDPNGGYAIIGGYVYRGSEYSFLQGYYICSDYISGNGWLIFRKNGLQSVKRYTFPEQIVSYGEAENGTLYAVSLTGIVYKITATSTAKKEAPIAVNKAS